MSTALAITGLRKSFGRHAALDGVDLTVATGEVYGLLGPNGAGKTTLMKIVSGLARPDSGEVAVLGRPFLTTAPGRRSAHPPGGRGLLRRVGSLVEEPGLWDGLSAVRHLRDHARLRGVPAGRVEEVLAVVGMEGVRDRKAAKYSLGMRWRLGIAIALLGAPRLLVLDEPTNGLDPVGMRDMRDLLRRLAADGVTVFVSSHQLDQIARTCDRVGVLVAGRTRYEGALDGLARDGDLESGFFALLEATASAVR